MGIYPIRNEADHRRALARIEVLMDAASLTAHQESELDALVTLVEAYESKRFPIGDANPIQVIEFMMDQNGLTRKDLEPMIGSRARVSEVLNRKRPLTLAMIRALSAGLHIPADLLVGETKPGGVMRRRSIATAKPRSREATKQNGVSLQSRRSAAA